MNVMQKGGLTVVVATVIASVIILSSNKSVADNSKESSKATTVTAKEEIKVELLIPEKHIGDSEKEGSLEQAVAVKTQSIAPPPGPFFTGGTSPDINITMPTPIAPQAPTARTSTAQITQEKQKPLQANGPSKNTEKPVLNVKIAKSPEFKREKPSIASALSEVPKAPVMKPLKKVAPNQPIWMQPPPQTIVPQPTRPIMANGQPMMQGGVPNQIMPKLPSAFGMPSNQRYMYIPVPTYQPRFAYPQHYNSSAGNYIAPQTQLNNAMPMTSDKNMEIKKGTSKQ